MSKIPYKYTLFEKAADLQQKLIDCKSFSNKYMIQFESVMDELFYNGWREEFDLWYQKLKD